MKRIIIVLGMILPVVANAANMCIKDDAVMIVLDPQVAGTALSNNEEGKTWSTRFSYGIISGIGGCHNVGTGTTLVVGGVASDQVNITSYSSGRYCYCKMLKPMESAWVYSGLNNIYSCYQDCASRCSETIASSVDLRAGLFGNIVQ